MSARTLKNCLVVSRDGGNRQVEYVLQEKGFSLIPSGNGQEGVAALGRFKPKMIILFFNPEDQDDVLVLRAVQAVFQERYFEIRAVIISPDVKATARLLGKAAKNRHCTVLPDWSNRRALARLECLENMGRVIGGR